MKNRFGRLLAVASAGTWVALGASCAMLGWFEGGYELEIRPVANVSSQLQSLYVIVTPKEHVMEPLLSPSKYGDLLEEARMRKYSSLMQFQPSVGSWKLVYSGNQSGFVEYDVDGESLYVDISHDLIGKAGMTEYCAVVLAFFGSEGFEQVTINHPSLDAKLEQILDVGSGSLSLRDA